MKAGFDGVEIHGSQRYLINTFLSRAWNKRQDAYGCQDLESRARFGVEVMQAVRERVGQDFIPGLIVTRAEQIKKRVSIPVISGGRIEPHVAEWDLQEGKIDLVFMGRRLLADPQLPNKLVSGRPEDIAPCTACCECMEALLTDGQVRCRVNAALGKEQEYELKPAKKKKRSSSWVADLLGWRRRESLQ